MCPISGKEERDAGRWYSSGKLGLTSIPQGVRRYFCYTVLLVMLSVEEIPLSLLVPPLSPISPCSGAWALFIVFISFNPFSFPFFSISHFFLFHFSPFPLLVSSPFNYILCPFFPPVLIPSLPLPTSTSFPTPFSSMCCPLLSQSLFLFSLFHLFSTSFHHFSLTVKFRK